MISPRWRLIARTIWSYKARSLLVVLSIAVGVFAVGTVAHMYVISSRDLVGSYALVSPANASVFTDEPFEEELVNVVRKLPEVREAEGRRSLVVRFRLEGESAWRPLLLFAVPNFDMQVNKVQPEFYDDGGFNAAEGHWPPLKREIAIERTSLLSAQLGMLHAHVGGTMTIETPDRRHHDLRISGLSYDFSRTPATFAGIAYGYIDMDTLEWLGQPRDFNELHIVVAGDTADRQRNQQIADLVRAKVEKSGRTVTRAEVPEPGKLPLDGMFRSISLILGILGVLALLLSGFLVVNTITALLKQQVRQLGVMKAIGARAGQLVRMYLAMILLFGALALALAVPLAGFLARWFIGFMSLFLNFKLTSFAVPPDVLLIEIAVGLLVPLLAGLYPVIAGTRVTVLQAINDHGTGGGLGQSRVDRLIESIRGLPRPVLLSLRNTFRRKQRLLLTLTTLTLAGVTFVSVLSVRASLSGTLDQALAYWNYDIGVTFTRPHRVAQVEREALSVPGVERVESWDSLVTYRLRPDDTESAIIAVTALPPDSQMVKPTVLRGRWLEPGDTNAIVINNALAEAEPDLDLGASVTLKLGDRKTVWEVVGVVQSLGSDLSAYAALEGAARISRRVGQASSIQIATADSSPEAQAAVAKALEAQLKARGIEIGTTQLLSDIRAQNETLFTILTTLLLAMALLLTAVGGLGLTGTMSINVIERMREIGVMRAIGATDDAIGQIFTIEAVVIGVISAVLGSLLALPVGRWMSDAVGKLLFQAPLRYSFSLTGVAIWLVGMVVLAVVASLMPARHAMRLRVREVLAHE
jgi:putative ABC transport system permease protein